MEQNLQLYKIFFTVANAGSISKAAKELYISQPAISKSIKKLEESIGIPLFTRNSKGVTLTEDGNILYTQLSSAFKMIDDGESVLKQKSELGIGHITIGVSSTLCKYILLPYLKGYIKQNPHVQITIECHSTAKTLELLHNNKIDIGLIGTTENILSDHFHYLRDINYIFVTNNYYLNNLHARNIDTVDSVFKNGNIILLDKDNISRRYVENYFSEHHYTVTNPLEINNMDLIIDFAKIGLGIGCVIKEFIRKELDNGSLVEIPLPNPIPARKIGFVFNKSKMYSPAVTEFMKMLKKLKISI